MVRGRGTFENSAQVSDKKILNDLRDFYQYHHNLLYCVSKIRRMMLIGVVEVVGCRGTERLTTVMTSLMVEANLARG